MSDSIGSNIAEGLVEIVKNTAKTVINVPSQIGKTAVKQISGTQITEEENRQKTDQVKLLKIRQALHQEAQSAGNAPAPKNAKEETAEQEKKQKRLEEIKEQKRKSPIPYIGKSTGERKDTKSA